MKVGPYFDEEPEEDDNKMPILSQKLEDVAQDTTKTETEQSKQVIIWFFLCPYSK